MSALAVSSTTCAHCSGKRSIHTSVCMYCLQAACELCKSWSVCCAAARDVREPLGFAAAALKMQRGVRKASLAQLQMLAVWAARAGFPAALAQLLPAVGPNLRVDGRALVHIAVAANQRAVVDLLVFWGADINAVCSIAGRTALDYFVPVPGSETLLRWLLGWHGRTSRSNWCHIVNKAIGFGSVEVVREFALRGCDLGAADDAGVTPLQAAVVKGSVDCAAIILDTGVPVPKAVALDAQRHGMDAVWAAYEKWSQQEDSARCAPLTSPS